MAKWEHYYDGKVGMLATEIPAATTTALSVTALKGTVEALEVEATVAHAISQVEVEQARYSAFATAVATTSSSTQSSGGFDVGIVLAFGGFLLTSGGLYLQWRKEKREQEAHEEKLEDDEEDEDS